jgi:phage N-6-adenine-methyltransferase
MGNRIRFAPSGLCICCWERAKGDYNKKRKKLERSAPKVYHRHNTIEWETPQWFFETLNAEFEFTLDVCAQPVNAKCPRFFTPEDDGLAQPWEGVCWCNPPYGRNVIDPWIAKARQSAMQGAIVVCLVPVRTDTKWWHSHVVHGEIRFLERRLKFGGATNPAPFPNAVVIFRPPHGVNHR